MKAARREGERCSETERDLNGEGTRARESDRDRTGVHGWDYKRTEIVLILTAILILLLFE